MNAPLRIAPAPIVDDFEPPTPTPAQFEALRLIRLDCEMLSLRVDNVCKDAVDAWRASVPLDHDGHAAAGHYREALKRALTHLEQARDLLRTAGRVG